MDTESRTIFLAGISFLTGLILGLGTGILLAPQAGTNTRKRIGEAMEDSSQQLGKWMVDAKERVQDLTEEGKKLASRVTSK
ncbi:YtxH domain-containing protein [Candidatus Nitronereus thalassa]|uniref:YtxH domain-containing protein n=1 Tax=Candidatus Nitronereus thalassa TaxID=3020898 RepID=A0ABU3KBA6_9BACT|nr:YtxH domain-containing protein [Candidatus Nitronereus thalassa]MDT7043775.1 YtxH domain-containing protein [Candidatus Nitronereus thalassa]